MRVVTYNIWRGGEDRLADIFRTLKDLQPDILCIQEANVFDVNGRAELLGPILGLRNFWLQRGGETSTGKRYHTYVTSKFQLETIPIDGSFRHAAQHHIVQTEQGPLSFVNAHLSWKAEDDRVHEIESIIAAQQGYKRCFIAGDLNTLKESDNYNPADIEKMGDHLKTNFTKDGTYRFDVTNKLIAAGYQDAFEGEPMRTFPTKLRHFDDGLEFHVDYVWLKGIEAKEKEVVRTEATHHGSDHYPLVVDLDVR